MMNTLTALSAPIGRLLLALIFVMSGISKISGYEATQGYMAAMGVSGSLLPLVIITEVVGGLAIILGWKTRIAAFALAGFCILSAILFHSNFSDQIQMIMFLKNLAMAGGFLLLFSHGPGAYAMDNRNDDKID